MRKRKFTSKFKAKVVLEMLTERSSVNELAQKYELHAQQLSKWKKEFLLGAEGIFEGKHKSLEHAQDEEKSRLLRTIGELKVENDFLRKVLR